jgi:hypothetical protein
MAVIFTVLTIFDVLLQPLVKQLLNVITFAKDENGMKREN